MEAEKTAWVAVRAREADELMNGAPAALTPLDEGVAWQKAAGEFLQQFYEALKLRRVETVLVRIPGASHNINNRPSNMLAQVLNTSAWFEKHK